VSTGRFQLRSPLSTAVAEGSPLSFGNGGKRAGQGIWPATLCTPTDWLARALLPIATHLRRPQLPPSSTRPLANDQAANPRRLYLTWHSASQATSDPAWQLACTDAKPRPTDLPPLDDASVQGKAIALLADTDCQYVRDGRLQPLRGSEDTSPMSVLTKRACAEVVGPIFDQSYYAYPGSDALIGEDLNDRLELSNGLQAVCRHRAAEEVGSRRRDDAERSEQPRNGRWAERRADKFSRTVNGKVTLPAELEARYKAMHDSNAPCAIVQNDSWGAFFGHAFDAMSRDSVKYFLCLTHDHVTVLRLRRKGDGPSSEYVASLYDTVMPLTHVRCATREISGVKRFGIETFIHPASMPTYFGHGDTVSHEVVFQEIASEDSPAPSDADTETGRVVKLFGRQPLSPTGAYQLFKRGLSFDFVRSALTQKGDPAERLALLAAKDIDGWPGLSAAFKFNRPSAIRDFGAIILNECDAGRLAKDDLFALLEGNGPQGEPAILCALQEKATDAIGAYGRLLIEAWKRGHLTGDQVKRLLSGRWKDFPLLSRAVTMGDEALVKCVCNVINDAHSAGCLTGAPAAALVDEPSGARNRSALAIAGVRSRPDLIDAIKSSTVAFLPKALQPSADGLS
jgi:hypothetical protein